MAVLRGCSSYAKFGERAENHLQGTVLVLVYNLIIKNYSIVLSSNNLKGVESMIMC